MDPLLEAMFGPFAGGLGGGGFSPMGLENVGAGFQMPGDFTGQLAPPEPPPPVPAPMPPTPPVSQMPGIGTEIPWSASLGATLGPTPPGAAGAPYQPPGSTAASVGGSMANTPFPFPGLGAGMPTQSFGANPITQGQQADAAKAQASQQQNFGQKLSEALKGIQAPKGPDVLKPSTPPPPRPGAFHQSELANLMASLGIGPRDMMQRMGGGVRIPIVGQL